MPGTTALVCKKAIPDNNYFSPLERKPPKAHKEIYYQTREKNARSNPII